MMVMVKLNKVRMKVGIFISYLLFFKGDIFWCYVIKVGNGVYMGFGVCVLVLLNI